MNYSVFSNIKSRTKGNQYKVRLIHASTIFFSIFVRLLKRSKITIYINMCVCIIIFLCTSVYKVFMWYILQNKCHICFMIKSNLLVLWLNLQAVSFYIQSKVNNK